MPFHLLYLRQSYLYHLSLTLPCHFCSLFPFIFAPFTGGRINRETQGATCTLELIILDHISKGVDFRYSYQKHPHIQSDGYANLLDVPSISLSILNILLYPALFFFLPVAHTYNPSYSEGRDQEDPGSKPARANNFRDPILKKPITKEGWRSGSRCRPWVQTRIYIHKTLNSKKQISPPQPKEQLDKRHEWDCCGRGQAREMANKYMRFSMSLAIKETLVKA
jgi:hypothetical protein